VEQRPTKKQKELLSFIDGFIKGNGYGPSYREIMRALDYRSVSTVATHVDGLIARGWLVKKDNSARSLTVVMPDDHEQQTLDVEAVIRAKIAQLQNDRDTHADAIATLEHALELLGYVPDKTDLA
jgi:repressor LexA